EQTGRPARKSLWATPPQRKMIGRARDPPLRVTLLRIFLSSEGLEIKGAITWPKAKGEKTKIKRKRRSKSRPKKRSTRKVCVLTPLVSDDALERAYSV